MARERERDGAWERVREEMEGEGGWGAGGRGEIAISLLG
jgi:hypothetical protein